MNKRRRKSNASHNLSTTREYWDDEYQRFAEWSDSEQKLFGVGHSWQEIRAEKWGDDVVLHRYKCVRCNSEHAVRFYANGLKIDIDEAGNCDELMKTDLTARLARSRADAKMMRGNLLGIQRRIRASRPGWEAEVFLTLKRLMSAAGSVEATLNMMGVGTAPSEDLAPKPVVFLNRLRVVPKETKDGLSALATADRLGLSVSTVIEMLRDGRLLGRKIGKAWRVRPDSIDLLVKKSTVTRPGRANTTSPAAVLNRKTNAHDWVDDENTVKCLCCGLTMPAALPWRQQLGFAKLNACSMNRG